MMSHTCPERRHGHLPCAGRLIVFEGADGVGKTAIAERFYGLLRERGEDVLLLSFPGSTEGTLGNLVYGLHHDPCAHGILECPPASMQLLHVAAHIDLIERHILPAIERGRTVILDRYWWSTFAYGQLRGVSQASLRRMIAIEKNHWRGVRPAPMIVIRRAEPFGHELSRSEFRTLESTYRRLAKREAAKYPVHTVENVGSIHETLEKVSAVCGLPKSGVRQRSEDLAKEKWRQNSLLEGPDVVVDVPVCVSRQEWNQSREERFRELTKRWLPVRPTRVFMTYWEFAAKRQDIFFRRFAGEPPPWTRDWILQKYKFTNAYRASDRVSQYLIRHVIYKGGQEPEGVFFRIVLFKLFNKIETWELLRHELGELTWEDYSFRRYDEVLSGAMRRNVRIYSAAYVMPSARAAFGYDRKHANNLRLLEAMMRDEVPNGLSGARTMQDGFEVLRSYPSMGDFLSYQYMTDVNYSRITDFSEMDFVVPGPGARDGISKCFECLGGLNEAEIIQQCADRQSEEFRQQGISFRSLWGRPLQLIDCQNLFCEVGKYARVAHPGVKGQSGRTRVKQRYTWRRERIDFMYPPKWGINERIRPLPRQGGT